MIQDKTTDRNGKSCNEKSTNGTNYTDLKSKEICSIIKTCREGGVTEITLGGLHIKFGGADQTAQIADQRMPLMDEQPTSDHMQIPVAHEIKEAMDAQKLIADPVLWEEEEIDRQVYALGESNEQISN